MISTVFKWQGAAALAMPGLACLTFLGTNRRKLIASITGYGSIAALFSYWVVFVYKALEGDTYLPGVKPTKPTLAFVVENYRYLVSSLGPALIYTLLPLASFLLPLLVPRFRRLYS